MKKAWLMMILFVISLYLTGCQAYEAAKINTFGSDKGAIEVLGTDWLKS